MRKYNRFYILAILFILSSCVSTPSTPGANQVSIDENLNQTISVTEAVQENSTETQSVSTQEPAVPTPTVLASDVGSDSIGDTYYSDLGNGGYDVQKYTIVLDVNMKSGEMTAVTRIDAIATQDLSIFSLDFTGLTWDAVRVNQVDAEFSRKIRKLEIQPHEMLAKNEEFTVEVEYHGAPWTVTSVAGGTVGWFRAMDGTINVFTEPDGAYSWFPCNNHPRDKALYRFEITVDDPWIAAANGLLIETIPGNGKTTYIFEMNEPMATYLATVNIGHYDLETMPGPDDILIRNYFPADFPDEQRKEFEIIPEVIEFYSSLFGPYPSTVYGVLIMDKNTSHCPISPFGDETQSLTIFCPRFSSAYEGNIVHELAHEWFGDSVSLENWQDLWLKEGMATYAWCLWEARNGDDTDLSICMKEEMGEGYEGTHAVDQPPRNDLFCTEAYRGGSFVYYSLHQKVGDEMFFDIMRTYLDRYRGSYAGTDEFIAVAEEVSGQDLEESIREWLQDPVIPE